jgi:broad specificity phosphatase PhoE
MHTYVHLLRHGEVDNPNDVVYERLPGFKLSQRGERMAQAVAKFISENDQLSRIEQIYSSPLERALQTAAPVAQALGGLEVQVDERLTEARNNFAGHNPKARTLELVKQGKLKTLWQHYHSPYTPSWGEPYVEIANRMRSVIEELYKLHASKHILLVSHQSPIWNARRLMEQHSLKCLPQQRVCALASITTLVFDVNAQGLVEVNYRTPAASI